MKITTDYPGGNAIIREINENEVKLEQDLKGTGEWWFYWNFKVIDPPKGKVRFTFLNDEVVSPHGPATSTDGVNWAWHTDGFVDHDCEKVGTPLKIKDNTIMLLKSF